MSNVTLHGDTVRLDGKLLQVGDKLPNGNLVANDLKEVKLLDTKGENKLILTLPSVDTDVCANEIKNINKWLGEEDGKNNHFGSVIVISQDLPFAQKRFLDQHKIDRVLAYSQFRDPSLAQKLGVAIESGPLQGLSARAVFLTKRVNGVDTVKYVELVPEITSEPNYKAARHALANIQ